MVALQITWFILIGILMAGYTVLAGFDLGAGYLFYRFRSAEEREAISYNLRPIWGVNQVWLLTGGGALFAAFPKVYAGVFSGFYLALMLLLLVLVLRAVAIEIKPEVNSARWIRFWDEAYFIGSALVCLLLGVAMGNLLAGIPLDVKGNYTGGFWDLLNLFAIGTGLFSVSIFALQGAGFLMAVGPDQLREKASQIAFRYWLVSLVLFLLLSVYCFINEPQVFANYYHYPLLYVIPALLVACYGIYPVVLKKMAAYIPMLVSSLLILSLWGVIGGAMFPALVPNAADPAASLTLYNSSSSLLTLKVMLILAIIGVPIVLFYIGVIYRQFFAGRSLSQSIDSSAGELSQ